MRRIPPTVRVLMPLLLAIAIASPVLGRPPAAAAGGYTVSGNHILDPNGNIFFIHGVARSGFETSASGDGHFTQADFNNIAAWKANTVRIATNQDFLLSDSCYYNPNYLANLDNTVAVANNAGLNVIFDLHWSDRGQSCINTMGQQQMADSRSLTFWQQMAAHYKNNPRVFFELYNEPHDISWSCWLNGCTTSQGWTAVGMQQLYNTVRNAGFNNLVIIGGLNWAYDLSGVASYPVQGTNIVYATHPYNYSDKQPSDWHRAFGYLTSSKPVVATEFGQFDCGTSYVSQAIAYFDAPDGVAANQMGWTGWAWNSPGSCGFPSIIADWNGTPSTMGKPEHDALIRYASSPTPTPTPGAATQPPTRTPTPAPTSTPAATSTATAATPTPTPTGNGYTFEDGTTDGWTISGSPFTGDANSTARAFDGTHSLSITASGFSSSSYPWVQVTPPSSLGAGATITAHVWVPSGTNLAAQLFVSDHGYTWHTAGYKSLAPGTWTTLTFTVPSGTSVPLRALGVQFQNKSSTSFSCTLYLDAVTW